LWRWGTTIDGRSIGDKGIDVLWAAWPNKPMVPTAPALPAVNPLYPLRLHTGQSLEITHVL
jgi:hypothetical protein